MSEEKVYNINLTASEIKEIIELIESVRTENIDNSLLASLQEQKEMQDADR